MDPSLSSVPLPPSWPDHVKSAFLNAAIRDYPIRHAEAGSQYERFGTPPHGGRPVPRISG